MKVSHLKHLRALLHYYWYLYSPTLLDSQELSSQRCRKKLPSFIHTHFPLRMTLLSPVTTILPKLRGSPMGNGDAERTSLAACAVDQDLLLRRNSTVFFQWKWRGITVCGTRSMCRNYYYASGLGVGNGNGEWRRCSWIPDQAAGDAGSSTLYWGRVSGVMDNVEWSTEHGNIYSALSLRCWSIIKDLPPCKVCLIFHTFWKGLIFILLLDVTFNSTKMLIPEEMPCKSGTPWFTHDSNRVQWIFGKFFRTICHSFDSGFKKAYQNNIRTDQ